jgi:flagellar biosynthesis regulator FlaF
MEKQYSAFQKPKQARPRFRIQFENQENDSPNALEAIPSKRSSTQSSTSDVIRIQEKNIATLKERFNQLRAANTASKAEARMKVIDLQRKIANAQNRQKVLTARIADLESGIDNQAKEDMAANVIEDIWCELQDFRGKIRSRANYQDEMKCVSDDDMSCITNDESIDATSIIPSIDDCTVHMTPVIQSSSAISAVSSPMVIDSTPVIADSPMIETPKKRSRKKTPITETPDFEGSIASRRTPRRGRDVYYKEPSMREALSPNSPFAFSLGEERVTPKIPEGYTRSPIPKKTRK